jgi:hypothetical protein
MVKILGNNGKAKVTALFIVAYDEEALCSRSLELGEDEELRARQDHKRRL